MSVFDNSLLYWGARPGPRNLGPQATSGPFSLTPRPFDLLAHMAWEMGLKKSHRFVGFALGRVEEFDEDVTEHLKRKCLEAIHSLAVTFAPKYRGREDAVRAVVSAVEDGNIFIQHTLWDQKDALEKAIWAFGVTNESEIIPLVMTSFDDMIKLRFKKRQFHNLRSLDAALVEAAKDEDFPCWAVGDALQLVRLAMNDVQVVKTELTEVKKDDDRGFCERLSQGYLEKMKRNMYPEVYEESESHPSPKRKRKTNKKKIEDVIVVKV